MKFRQEENRILDSGPARLCFVTLLVVILLVVLKRNGIVARGQDVPVQYVRETMGRCANGCRIFDYKVEMSRDADDSESLLIFFFIGRRAAASGCDPPHPSRH